ncbi:sensor histidine kinase [Dyadobacter sp. CY312]|uniref:sensor histidine kinase n=1 Tax=Dyadobacter sp. CY312 TaxID=2907303 RepID=UPI001F484952|nr:histidine kinase [Dyadobacter sp. CY312]MCE7039030.1 histidine kinase [Dyadobacter sp. CY312]
MKDPREPHEILFSRTEILFFVTFFVVFPILTSVEHDIYEKASLSVTFESIWEEIFLGTIRMFPYLLYYKMVLPFLFEKRYLIFGLLVLVLLLFLNLYKIYIQYWLVSKLWFLPEQTIRDATRWYESEVVLFHFSIMYIFRELLVVSALGYFVHSGKQEKQLNEIKNQQLQSELTYLKVQLQPHFFFNTLNNIFALAMQKSDKTAPLIARHAEMMRYILYHSNQQSVGLMKEVDFLKNYVEAEMLRYSDKTEISFETQGINDSYVIEPLLLLPFIENAFKHGLQDNTLGGFVCIVICLIENELTVQVRNSKLAEPSQHPKGIGLQNASGRLKLLYPKHQIFTSETENEYEVNLTLNLIAHD